MKVFIMSRIAHEINPLITHTCMVCGKTQTLELAQRPIGWVSNGIYTVCVDCYIDNLKKMSTEAKEMKLSNEQKSALIYYNLRSLTQEFNNLEDPYTFYVDSETYIHIAHFLMSDLYSRLEKNIVTDEESVFLSFCDKESGTENEKARKAFISYTYSAK